LLLGQLYRPEVEGRDASTSRLRSEQAIARPGRRDTCRSGDRGFL